MYRVIAFTNCGQPTASIGTFNTEAEAIAHIQKTHKRTKTASFEIVKVSRTIKRKITVTQTEQVIVHTHIKESFVEA